MGFKDKFLDFVAPAVDDEEETEVVETKASTKAQKPLNAYETKKTNIQGVPSNAQMALFEPRSFEESEDIARNLKLRKACLVNLHKLQRDSAQRTIDFLTGVVFAIDGSIQKIAQNTILLAPSNIGVDGSITLDHDE